jgi:hypothetical protein
METGTVQSQVVESIKVASADLLALLRQFDGQYVTVQISNHKGTIVTACGGTLNITCNRKLTEADGVRCRQDIKEGMEWWKRKNISRIITMQN